MAFSSSKEKGERGCWTIGRAGAKMPTHASVKKATRCGIQRFKYFNRSLPLIRRRSQDACCQSERRCGGQGCTVGIGRRVLGCEELTFGGRRVGDRADAVAVWRKRCIEGGLCGRRQRGRGAVG